VGSFSARGPCEFSAGQQMEVNMENGLTCVMAIIDDHTITVFIKPLLGSNGPGNEEQVPDDFTVRNANAMNICDMFFGHDERMDRRLGIEILKSDRVFIFVNNRCGDLFLDDPAKQAVWDRAHLFSPCMPPAKLLKKQERSPV